MNKCTKTIFFILLNAILSLPIQIKGNNSITENDYSSYLIDPSLYGAKGDGVVDDTRAFQQALTVCSEYGFTCKIADGKNYLISGPLFLWGKASLAGEAESSIIFDAGSAPYLINFGIKGPRKLGEPFSGVIDKITFKIIGGEGGRILFFWRTNGAKVTNNNFIVGNYRYSATSSGNDNNWVENGFANCIRKNIIIKGNVVIGEADEHGSEGFGLGHFDGVLIENNIVTGVGDDPIGIHFCKNVKIFKNNLKSVDGRLFVVNSKNVEIADNSHERMRSPKNSVFYKGISLLYIGFETLKDNDFMAPTDILVQKNKLYYPEKSFDSGAAIYLYGPRNVIVKENEIKNDSSIVTATAIHLLPARFSGSWRDPDRIDTKNIARVYSTKIEGNRSIGKNPLGIGMSGNCNEYEGRVIIENNLAKNFSFYCECVHQDANISTEDNTLKKK